MDNWIDQAIYNSYQVLTGYMSVEEIIEHCEIRREDINDLADLSVTPVFFIPPDEEVDNEDLDSMIAHFEEMECYEECAELLKLKK
tara:strand:- start:1221 stop:1478 length:258 start_codon:yes stop_codon:yes gene_type:complete